MCKNKKAPYLTSDNISNFFISAHEKHNRILPYIILATLALLFICLPVIPITGFSLAEMPEYSFMSATL